MLFYILIFHTGLDCKQSLFFLQLATRVKERRAAKPRDARNDSSVCILARFVRRTKKTETARSLTLDGQEVTARS